MRYVTEELELRIDELFALYATSAQKHSAAADEVVDISEFGTLVRALGLQPSNAQLKTSLEEHQLTTKNSFTKQQLLDAYCDEESLPDRPNVEDDLRRVYDTFPLVEESDEEGEQDPSAVGEPKKKKKIGVSRKVVEESLFTTGESMNREEQEYFKTLFVTVGLEKVSTLTFDEFYLVMTGGPRGAEETTTTTDSAPPPPLTSVTAPPAPADGDDGKHGESSQRSGQSGQSILGSIRAEGPEGSSKRSQNGKSRRLEAWEELQLRMPGLEEDNKEHKKQRMDLFAQFDPNRNGYLSLAEVDSGCRSILHLDQLAPRNLPKILFLAFNAAKDFRKAAGRTKKLADEYVERCEFRIFFVYVFQYFELWTLFEEMDSGDGDDAGDGRLTKAEFRQAMPTLEKWGVDIDDARVRFDAVDADGGGHILFGEFADWCLRKAPLWSSECPDSEDEREEVAATEVAASTAAAVGGAEDDDDDDTVEH